MNLSRRHFLGALIAVPFVPKVQSAPPIYSFPKFMKRDGPVPVVWGDIRLDGHPPVDYYITSRAEAERISRDICLRPKMITTNIIISPELDGLIL